MVAAESIVAVSPRTITASAATNRRVCRECEGQGTVPDRNPNDPTHELVTCEECRGTGLDGLMCPTCEGGCRVTEVGGDSRDVREVTCSTCDGLGEVW